MVIRSLVASTILAGYLTAGSAQAQVVLCPNSPSSNVAVADVPIEAERLLKRLVIALDLHGHRGISEQAIMQAHAETPSALMAKLVNVVDRCMKASGDLEGFYEALPGLRKAFLDAVNVAATTDAEGEGAHDQQIQAAALDAAGAERLEQSINLSVRELWRKLWFRPAEGHAGSQNRWAVIVASPPDADSGWDELGDHQRRWIDTYFQLHEPYYESNPHHAIVVGRRLPESQANRLLDYVIELGMAEDAYLWQLPEDEGGDEVAAPASVDMEAEAEEGNEEAKREGLDLSVLDQ